MADTPTAEPISKSDRMELRRIVKARFEVLREQLGQRANELHRMVKMTIEDEAKADVEKAEKEGREITKECKALARKISSFEARMSAKGITNGHGDYYTPEKEMQEIVDRFLTGWAPADLNERTKTIVSKIKNEHGIHGLELRTNELSLLEDLSVDALQGSEARKFLGQIPEIDTLLPLPEAEARKALVAGS